MKNVGLQLSFVEFRRTNKVNFKLLLTRGESKLFVIILYKHLKRASFGDSIQNKNTTTLKHLTP